jgi:tRNA-dihydrouridine synthase
MFYNISVKPFFVLAPMDDVSDTVFRQVVAGCAAPDLLFTEFVNVDGLQSQGRARLLKKLRFAPPETSLVAHIWGLRPENFYQTAREIVDGTFAREMGLPEGCNFVGIDLNMGCPAKSEVRAGACSALMKNRPLAAEIIQATQEGAGGKLPVSVKTRLGFSEVDMSWPEFLLQHHLPMLTMHARTRKDMSKVEARWEYLPELVKLRDNISPETKIVANGDILNREHGLELAEKYRLDGLMIGRGIFQNPFAFATGYDPVAKWGAVSRGERIGLYKWHVELFAKTWQNGERPIHTLNKFCKIYISDFDGAKELREELMNCHSTDELLAAMDKTAVPA